MAVVKVHEAKTQLSKLMARAEAGEEIIIARGGEPVVRLVPIKRKGQRRPGMLRGKFEVGPEFFDPLPEEELAAWEGAHGIDP